MDNYLKFVEYRETYSSFVYSGFEYNVKNNILNIKYNFEILGLCSFSPTWQFPLSESFNVKDNKDIIENCVFNLGMIELLSYWKLTCSPKILIKCAKLSDEQIKWWKKLYINGLGEFLYTNNIYPKLKYVNDYTVITDKNENLVDIVNMGASIYKVSDKNIDLKGNLIPVGGGKDSIVSMEILSQIKNENMVYIVNPRGASKKSSKIAGYNKIYAPKRVLDTNMLDLNKKGFLNGHTPFSAILAFSAYLSAIVTNKKYIVLSNESSANEPTVSGTKVNHQYSKSIEFENDVRSYFKNYILSGGPEYFSLLRILNEWQIAKIFCQYPKYFKEFKSCNVGSKQDVWCENCAKCLYVYILLAAFLDQDTLKEIFTTDMLDNYELKEIFEGLVYPDYNKPFECVGTKEEVNLCLNTILKKYSSQNKELPCLLKNYTKISEEEYTVLLNKISNSWNEENNVIYEYKKLVKEYLEI